MNRNERFSRRALLQSTAAIGVTACVKKPGFCAQPAIIDDGEFRTTEVCRLTAENLEGPFYITDAPERNNFRIWDDEGVSVSLTGRVVAGDCSNALEGAIIEFWHANPRGDYDNESTEMRYRGAIQVTSTGAYTLETLLPGRYLNGNQYRPHHIHVKIWDADGSERLTTQLYFEGDDYLNCDPFANTSLVVPFEGDLATEIIAIDVDFIV